MKRQHLFEKIVISFLLILLAGCATDDVYFEPNMDFGSLQSVAVVPFQNLTGQDEAAERVRDTFMGMLLATEAVYVVPTGEVARGISRIGRIPPEGLSSEQIKQLGEHPGSRGRHYRCVEGIRDGEIRYDLRKRHLAQSSDDRGQRRPGRMVGVIDKGRHNRMGSSLRWRRRAHEYRHGKGHQ